MELYTLDSLDCSNKKVLMRIDCNIELGQIEKASDSFRLKLIKESVEYILAFPGATISLLSHFGRPGGQIDARYSLLQLKPLLEEILEEPLEFVDDCLKSPTFEKTRLALLENVRFYDKEEQNDAVFAERLANSYDLYVNEAFSVSHRAHASVEAITNFLPSVAGFHLVHEISALEKALIYPERPAVAILGGDKIETKLPLIRAFEEKYDAVLIGGKIANEALDEKIQFSDKVLLPMDFRSEDRLDIGDETVLRYVEIIHQAKTIIWNGPLGKFEEEPYDEGTKRVAEAIGESKAYVIAGGGESLAVIENMNLEERIDLVSSGGGALLSFLAGEILPGLECLKER